MADAGRASARWLGTWCVAMLCWSGVGGGPAVAGEFACGAGYSLIRDSNITRVQTDPLAEWTQTLYGGLAYRENTVDLNARLLAQVERRYFVHDTFSDNTGYFLEGAAVWTLAPQQFSWTFEDVLSEVRQDITAPDTPTNRARTNSMSTGPDLVFRVNPANSPVVGARYGRLDVEGAGGDNERIAAYARWLYRASASGTFSLNYEVTRADFEPPATFIQAVREDKFVRYFTRPALGVTTIDLGTTRVRFKGGEEMNGRLARLSVTRQTTSESALRVLISDEISDTYSDLLGRLASPTVPAGGGAMGPLQESSAATGDTYRNQRRDLTYSNQGARSGYSLQGYARSIDYEKLNQDYEEMGWRLQWNWFYSVVTRVNANADYLRRTFLSFERTDVERSIRVGVNFRLTRELSLMAEGTRMENESSAPLGNFVNQRAMLFLSYSTGPLYAVQPRR